MRRTESGHDNCGAVDCRAGQAAAARGWLAAGLLLASGLMGTGVRAETAPTWQAAPKVVAAEAQKSLPFGQELLADGDFERGGQAVPGAGISPGWFDLSSWADLKVTYNLEGGAPHGGRVAQKITVSNLKSGCVFFVNQQRIKVVPHGLYRISLWLRGEVENGAPVEIYLRKEGAPWTDYSGDFVTVTKEWKRYTFDLVPLVTDDAALFVIKLNGNSTLEVDDVSCRLVSMQSRAISVTPPRKPVPASYFNMHIHHFGEPTWPFVPFYGWRFWDTGTEWARLEKVKGQWDFKRLDHLVNRALEHGVEPYLAMGQTPAWAAVNPKADSPYEPGLSSPPKNHDDWKNYVRTVATRYKGKMPCYEIWNEPNWGGFYSGSPATLAELEKEAAVILKQVDPANTVISPGICFTQSYSGRLFLHNYLQAGGGRQADVIGIHLYTGDVGVFTIGEILKIKRMLAQHGLGSLPVWNTETGIASPARADGDAVQMRKAAGELASEHLINWACGVERYYYYCWDNENLGLVGGGPGGPGVPVKPVGNAYGAIRAWLLGAVMESLEADAAGTWTCRLRGPDGRRRLIVWNLDQTVEFSLKGQTFKQASDLYGKIEDLRGKDTLPVDYFPRLLE
ncbi:MAG: glycosyl hydrolase [Lentisphaeria bacterium]